MTLADVTGHGIGPALLAAVCRAYARSIFAFAASIPVALEHINRALGSALTTGRFITFAAAVCCPGCSDVELLSAGHGPIIAYSRSEDRFSRFNAHALPLGILPEFRSDPPTRLHLCAGDILLLVTDGLFEWENCQGEEFGICRIESLVRQSRDLSSQRIIERLHQAVRAFSLGSAQQDNLTAVVTKRL